MPKLSDLLVEKTSASVDIGGSKLAFQFYVMWRERFSDEELQAHVGAPFRDYIKVWLPRVLLSWDLVDDDAHAVPVTAEAIDRHEIPDSLLLEIHNRVTGSDLSGKVRPTTSRP